MAGKEVFTDIPQRKIGEKCAVFGIYDTKGSLDIARTTARGLHALQHRGQEASGISSSDGNTIYTYKRRGLVNQVFDDEDPAIFSFDMLPGNRAIGHNRYATSRASFIKGCHLQPVIDEENVLAAAHNGNEPDLESIAKFLDERGVDYQNKNDTEMMHVTLLDFIKRGASLAEAMEQAYRLFKGAFSLIAMDDEQIVGIRDKCGIRPFSIGRLNGSYILSSETCALDILNANYIRDVNPGEMVIIDEHGLRSTSLGEGHQRLDVFEFIYFARPDSMLLGKRVGLARTELGRVSAREMKHNNADIVIGVPDSGTPYAIGFSQESGIPYAEGLVKNRYTGRSFQKPDKSSREVEIRAKLNPVREVLYNKIVLVEDDSMVRATVAGIVTAMLREAGAREVHWKISSSRVRNPDFYGIDTPSQSELIGADKCPKEISEYIGADSVEFLEYDSMIRGIGVAESLLSTSSFTGDYPIDIGKRWGEFVPKRAN